METPLHPTITLQDRRGLTVCECCGVQDGTVRQLVFRREDRGAAPVQGSSTVVALCGGCRGTTRRALSEEVLPEEAPGRAGPGPEAWSVTSTDAPTWPPVTVRIRLRSSSGVAAVVYATRAHAPDGTAVVRVRAGLEIDSARDQAVYLRLAASWLDRAAGRGDQGPRLTEGSSAGWAWLEAAYPLAWGDLSAALGVREDAAGPVAGPPTGSAPPGGAP